MRIFILLLLVFAAGFAQAQYAPNGQVVMGQVGCGRNHRYEDSYGDGCGMLHSSVGTHSSVSCYDFEGDSWVLEASGIVPCDFLRDLWRRGKRCGDFS